MAITRANVDSDLQCHMVILSNNDLTQMNIFAKITSFEK